jgi:hypothetical protein
MKTATMWKPELVGRMVEIEERAERAGALVEERSFEVWLEQWIGSVIERETERRRRIEQRIDGLRRRAKALAERDAKRRGK